MKRGRSLARPLVIAALALAFGLAGLVAYYRAPGASALPGFDGRVAVGTTSKTSRVELSVKEPDGQHGAALLELSVAAQPNTSDAWFVIVLTGDARPREAQYGAFGVWPDTPQPRVERPVFYIADVELASLEAEAPGTVLFGQFGDCQNDLCGTTVHIPARFPLITDHGAAWALSTPEFGVEIVYPELPDIPEQVDEMFLGPVVNPERIDPEYVQAFEGRHWYEPEEFQARFTLASSVMRGSVQQSGTPPEEHYGSVWAAEKPLKIDAVFTRPQKQEWAETLRFVAGLLIGLATGLLVWALGDFFRTDSG